MKMSEDISGLHLVEGTPICEDETGRVVAAFYSESEAAEVVHKVNCHDELVEALKAIQADLLERAETDSQGFKVADCGASVWIQLKEALAKAKG